MQPTSKNVAHIFCTYPKKFIFHTLLHAICWKLKEWRISLSVSEGSSGPLPTARSVRSESMTFHFSFCQHYLQCITGALCKIFLIGSSYALDKVLINLAFKVLRSWVVKFWSECARLQHGTDAPPLSPSQQRHSLKSRLWSCFSCLLALGTLIFLIEDLPHQFWAGSGAQPLLPQSRSPSWVPAGEGLYRSRIPRQHIVAGRRP